MMGACRLIVHADDFGLSEPVNNGIVAAHQRGILTSTSLIANGAAFAHAVSLAKQFPDLDIGVHLTLTEERPLSAPPLVPTLLDSTGHFHRNITSLAIENAKRRISLDQVHRELDAQIRSVLDQGIAVSHIDGHQHVHMLPGINRVVRNLASAHHIRAIRTPMERFSPYMLKSPKRLPRLLQMLVLNRFCSAFSFDDIRTPDHFFGFFFGGQLDESKLLALIERLPPHGVCELMCHPGEGDPSARYGHWNYHWLSELGALTGSAARARLNERNIALTSYREFLNH